jgi:hypothetical protein
MLSLVTPLARDFGVIAVLVLIINIGLYTQQRKNHDGRYFKHVGEVPYDSESIRLGAGYCIKGRCDNMLLSWPYDERFRVTNERLFQRV